MQTETKNVPAINVQEFQKIVGEAPAILDKNKNSLTKAKQVGEILFSYIEKDGMSDHYDAELNTYIGKLRATVNNMNTARKPFTQLVDNFRKMFTQVEGELKPIQDRAQKLRDDYATQKMEEQRKREKEAQAKLDQERERIEIKKRACIAISEMTNELISSGKTTMNQTLEDATLETLENVRHAIVNFNINIDEKQFDLKKISIIPLHISQDEVAQIKNEQLTEIMLDENGRYQSSIVAYKRELIDKLPSKKTELEELAIADEVETKRLQALAVKRKAEDKEKLERDAEAARRKSEEEANLKATAETTNAMVNTQANISFGEKPKVKEGYEIILSNTAAYLVLTQFWFDKEGKDWDVDRIEKMTFARVKKFCEKYAADNEEKVQSPFVSYKEIFKAK